MSHSSDEPGKDPKPGVKSASHLWLPAYCAIILSIVIVAWRRFLDFVPCKSPSLGFISDLRDFLNLTSPLPVIFLLAYVLVLIAWTLVTLVRFRFRRMLSPLRALVAIPLIIGALSWFEVFDPYYWYVLLNRNQFEREVKAAARPEFPAFVKLEGRDVSIGLAINPPTFTSIVYDGSDELGLAPSSRSPEWTVRNGGNLDRDGGGGQMLYSAQRLLGHFYLVTSTYP